MDARHDDVEFSQQLVVLIKAAVLKNVDLDSAETKTAPSPC